MILPKVYVLFRLGINQKVLSKNENHLEKTDISSEKTSEPLQQ
jgi:hypothetical protein